MRRAPELLLVIAIGSMGSLSRAEQPPGTPPLAVPNGATLAEWLQRADRDGLSEDPRWLALLHYEREWLPPRARSRASSPGFFLSDTGDRDPRAELIATLRAFLDPNAIVKDDEHAQCAFIARRHWLEQRLDVRIAEFVPVECPHYERWREALDARGLTLIFPEGFMSNPGSIFGHTLLRIDSGTEGSGEILGYAVDFTADAGDDGGLEYMFKGVTGSYPAIFGVHPYYEQLKRYADWENRDLWEYRLDIEQSELDFMLMHLWELRAIEFPYYFFTKNCSYELLRLLETGIVDLDVSAGFRGAVLPVETIRAIVGQPGLAEVRRYRPSPETQLRAASRSLSRPDRKRARSIAQGRLDPADDSLDEIPPERRARVLDVAYDQLRYEYLAGQVSDEASRGLSRRILIARSRIEGLAVETGSDAVEIETPGTSPDQGHETSLLALSGGWRDDEAFIDIRLRPALHGLMDNSGGYLQHTQIRLLDTVMRIYPESGQVRLQELTLLEILSLAPRSRVFRPWAWSVGTGLATRRLPEGGRLEDSPVWATATGIGIALDPAPAVLLYGLADLSLDVGPDLEDKVSFGPGARLGAFFGGVESRWKVHAFAEVTQFVAGDTTTSIRAGSDLRWITSRNTALIVEGSFNRSYGENWGEGSLQLNLHF